MTAGTSLERPVDSVADPESMATQGSTPAAAEVPGEQRRIPWLRIGAILGVLVPLGIMIRLATHGAPAFDGAMNLQVATNYSNGLGFVRIYGGSTLFPSEIQTSGVYIFLAAGFIKIFGASTFVYEIPNLIFIALLLVTVSLALRRWPVMRIIGPAAVLFCVPGMVENALHGYGEYVVAALVITAFVLVGKAAAGMRRPVLAVGGAWALIGIAFTIKVIAVLAVPVLVIGVLGLALARPAINRWKLSGAVLLAAIPVGLVELERLVELGSVRAFINYWKVQITNTGAQAGISNGTTATVSSSTGVGANDVAQGPATPIVQKIADHVHLLSVATGINAAVLLLVLALPFLVLVGLFLARHSSWREWLARPAAVLSVMLATYAGGYLVWWLVITPTSKAWLRRIVIALVVIAFLYLLLLGMAKDHWASRATRPSAVRSGRRNVTMGIAWAVAGVLGFLCVLPGIITANKQLTTVLGAAANSDVGVGQIQQLALAADQLRDEGDTLYGNGWWSAPVVALYADVPLGNLQTTNRCSADIVAGKAFIIWDFYATRLASPKPSSTNYDFTQISAGANNYGAIWKITLKSGITCPAA